MTNKRSFPGNITLFQVVVSLLILALTIGAIRDFREHSGRSAANGRLDLADRTGWQRVGPRSDVLLLIDANQSTLTAFPFGHEPEEAEMRGLVQASGMQLGAGSPHSLTGNPRGVATRGWMRSVECADDGWLVVMYVELGAGEATHRDTVEQARCLPQSAPDIAWPLSSIQLPPRR